MQQQEKKKRKPQKEKNTSKLNTLNIYTHNKTMRKLSIVIWGIFHILRKIVALEEREWWGKPFQQRQYKFFLTYYKLPRPQNLTTCILSWRASMEQKAAWSKAKAHWTSYLNIPQNYWVLSLSWSSSIIYSLWHHKLILVTKYILMMLFCGYHSLWHDLHVWQQ